MTKKIPKANRIKIIPEPIIKNEERFNKLLFSFTLFEQNKYFSVSGTCFKWTSDLLIVLQEMSNTDIKVFNSDRNFRNSYRIHNCASSNPPCSVPKSIPKEELIQFSLSISKGRVIGTLIENVFYIIWIDPHHNLYPDENHGGLTKHKIPSHCCCGEYMDEYNKMKEKIKGLEIENKELLELV